MPLTANSRLGPYEIKSLLGAGGMGEVYRAHDSRLNRDVAIKVLREEGASSPERRARFEREARAVAALNHPNIVAVYDFGVEGDKEFIVSELVEGESLRSLVNRPVPVRKLVEIAAQVADGLAAAHAARVVHRDLKPENIMIGKDGRVKILDFGLSRQASPDRAAGTGSDAEETFVPDVDATRNLTEEGTVIGTASYMSPEQATGRAVDYRSDQFSFGLVLHEMATGKHTFARSSRVETMAAIVRDEPPVIEEKIPAPLRWIIDRCLQKEPEQRYESTRDLFQDLKNLREHLSESFTSGTFTPVTTQAKARRWRVIAVCAGCVLLAGLLGYLLRPVGQDIGNYRHTRIASDAGSAGDGGAWSSDGKAVAYPGRVNGVYQVFLRYLNSPNSVQLTHEKRNIWPLGWSSDRSHLIALEDTGRKESPNHKLYSIATVGGEPEFIMDTDCSDCALSHDGKVFAAVMKGKDNAYTVEVSDPLGSPLRPYMPAPFASKNAAGADLCFSQDGRSILLYRIGDSYQQVWLLPYPAGGKPPRRILQKLPNSSIFLMFSWMPDNRHIVVSWPINEDSPTNLWIADIESNALTPLTNDTDGEDSPVVSPDGKSLLFSQNHPGENVVSVSVQDGSAQTLVDAGTSDLMPA
jgi:serine/threonine protein kinase